MRTKMAILSLPRAYYFTGFLVLAMIGGHYLFEPGFNPGWLIFELAMMLLAASLVYFMHSEQRKHYRELENLRQNEKDLNRKNEEIYEILRNVSNGMLVVSREHVIIFANKSFADQIGVPVENIRGHKCFELCRRRQASCDTFGDACPALKVFETGESYSHTHTHLNATGDQVLLDWTFFPVRDRYGEISSAIGITNDAAEKVKLKQQLQQAQKMEAVGLLAGGIAHDFNNILAAIMGYSELLLLELREFGASSRNEQLINFESRKSEIKTHAESIGTAVQKASKLTHDLMAFSRTLPADPRPAKLNRVVSEVQSILERVIRENITLSFKYSKKDPTILADKGQVEQVLMNLATNARDAMPDGGILLITTSRAYLNAETIEELGFGAPGNYATITFKDTGSGMDENTRLRIFEPFFTTKELGRGTGLGLSMAYGIMKQHGGYINVTSNPGQGTEFTLYFPESELEVFEDKIGYREDHQESSGVILLIEDSEQVREVTKMLLESVGYEVVVASDAEAGLEKFLQGPEIFDLLLTDLVLPGMNGHDLCLAIRKIRPNMPVIFASGYGEDVLNKSGVWNGEFPSLAKPFSKAALFETVAREIRKEKK